MSPPAVSAPPVSVTSEIGLLQQVVVHTPGEEMALVSPEHKHDLLFDDILFPERAREEHEVMCELFARIVGGPQGVLQLAVLLEETFLLEAARHDFVESLIRAMPQKHYGAYESELKRLDPAEMLRFAVTGQSPLPVSSHPLPNLMFTRDLCAVVDGHIILSHAAKAARVRESIIIGVILRHHPRFEDCRERLIELPEHVSFEGGDLLVMNERVVLIGHSERTTLSGVMAVVQALMEKTRVEHVLMVNLPRRRSCMHLDTVFTFIDRDECVVFPPIIEKHRNYVMEIRSADVPTRFTVEVFPTLKRALETVAGHPFSFIPCGGGEVINQRREQWTDGANLFALAPGLVVGYERNRHTFEALQRRGYHVVNAEGFLSYYRQGDIQSGARIAVKLEGHELSRGRGGPRCMTMPLSRARLDA